MTATVNIWIKYYVIATNSTQANLCLSALIMQHVLKAWVNAFVSTVNTSLLSQT